MSAQPTASGAEIKACCAAVYGSRWAQLLIGDVMHPGGIPLTLRLGTRLRLRPGDLVLDLATGRGVSARSLSRRFGCSVVGVDLSEANLEAARSRTAAGDRVVYEVGDAEELGFASGEFDAVICECAFCTFPDKERAAGEMARVVKPGGRIGIADLVRRGDLPPPLQTISAWVACIADARPETDYVAQLERAGFAQPSIEVHDYALAELASQIRLRLLGATVAQRLGRLKLPAADLEMAIDLTRTAEQAISDGLLGYVLISAKMS